MSWLVWLKQFTNKYLGGRYCDGFCTYYDDILEFDPLTGQWELVDRMIQARWYHAVSVIKYSEVDQFCNWGVNRYSRDIFSMQWFDIYLCKVSQEPPQSPKNYMDLCIMK